MKFLREMDLYKGIILLCVLALPACGWWCKVLSDSIAECKQTLALAPRLLQEIGEAQKKIELVVQNRLNTDDATKQPRKYFEGQIMAAASQKLETNDFKLSDPVGKNVSLPGSKSKVVDFVEDVNWIRKDLSLPLAFVYAVVFNCESGARPGGEQSGLQSIWKLQKLRIVNGTNERLQPSSGEIPPPEFEDRWMIKDMKFVRREPSREAR